MGHGGHSTKVRCQLAAGHELRACEPTWFQVTISLIRTEIGVLSIANIWIRELVRQIFLEAHGSRLELFRGVGRHFLNHGEDELAIAVVQAGGIATDLAEEADLVIRQLRQSLGAVAVIGIGKELRKRKLHGSGDLGKRVERRNCVTVFDARKVAAEKAGALFDVALRHAFLKAVVADGLADIHCREHFRMGHGNQSGNFWQGEICAIR